MSCRFQDGPQQSLLSGITHLSFWIMTDLTWENTVEVLLQHLCWSLGETIHHIVKTLQQPSGEARVESKGGLLITDSTDWPHLWIRYFRSSSSIFHQALYACSHGQHLTEYQAKIVKPLPNSWLRETVRESKCLICFQPPSCEVIGYTELDN